MVKIRNLKNHGAGHPAPIKKNIMNEICSQCNGAGFDWDFDPDERQSYQVECSHCDGDGCEPINDDDENDENENEND